MLQTKQFKLKSMMLGIFCAPLMWSSATLAEPTASQSNDMVVWDTVTDEAGATSEPTPKPQTTMQDIQVQERAIMEDGQAGGVATPDKGKPKKAEDSIDKFLEPTKPPAKVSKIVDIFLENKSKPQGFLTAYTTKRADTDLKLVQHQPSSIPAESRFQVSNFGNYIRLGHEETDRLIGYSKNYFGFNSVYLQKDYFEKRDFWSRFKVAPSGEKDWYLIRSYTEPKKCLTIGWSQKLRLKNCNINDKWQKWRFLREKSDAYWVPDMDLIDLDIM